MQKIRSVGVTVIATITILYATSHIILFLEKDIINTLFGICLFISAVGILKLKNWGRILIILLAIYDLISEVIPDILQSNKIIGDVINQHPNIPQQLLFLIGFFLLILLIIFDIFIIVFFTRPKVKEQFK